MCVDVFEIFGYMLRILSFVFQFEEEMAWNEYH